MKVDYSFKRGWSQVRKCDQQTVRNKLMQAMNLGHRASFYERLRGDTEPRVSEYAAITMVFAEYGITDVWGSDSAETKICEAV